MTQTLGPSPAAPGHSPSRPRPWFSIEHRVTAGDTSAVGPVYYARLIDWQGQCRERCGQLAAPIFSSDLTTGYAMLTQSCSCEYLQELYFGDLVAIRLTVLWVRMHLMHAQYHYYKIAAPGAEDGELVARGEQMWASARITNGHYEPCGWPRELIECAATYGADISRAQIEN